MTRVSVQRDAGNRHFHALGLYAPPLGALRPRASDKVSRGCQPAVQPGSVTKSRGQAYRVSSAANDRPLVVE